MPVQPLDVTKPLRGARARIRMYRVGLGDCFLLSVNDSGTIRHMLIDCGMFPGSRLDKNASEKDLQVRIVEHIAGETKKRLNAVVVTHEHMDHVSIFNSAKDVFKNIEIDEAWLGWVESDTKAARDLRAKYEIMETHLAAALTGLSGLHDQDKAFYSDVHDGVASVAEFLGFNADGTRLMEEVDEPVLGAAKPVKPQPRAAIDFVKQSARRRQFGSPGDIWNFAGLKVYVLGPPPAEKQMKIMERAGATYDTALGAVAGGDDGSVQSPFGQEWREPVEGSGPTFRLDESVVDGLVKDALDRYMDPKDAWRRIDTQALDSAPTLSLQIDKYINNTSLALAFEFLDGDVLLFPGDAQVGNWDWWFNIEQFNVKELLRRVIFYKVGHHGSHNATLKQALELMDNDKLVAMMPTHESFARKSKHWEMPAENLRPALLEHTKNRVLRNDQGVPGVDDPLRDGDWSELKDRVQVDPLFIDYYV